jgi:membrane-bound lytic murein transglycosylase A
MIAQDTGSAIVGPARADLYFGAGVDAGKVSGRMRHNMHFVMLVPKRLDPVERGRKMPLPDPRPSEQIAKVFPQSYPAKDRAEVNAAAPVAPSSTLAQATIPLPEPRPKTAPGPQLRHPYLWRYYLGRYYPR